MPNWCWNRLSISGNKEDMREFKKVLHKKDKYVIIDELSNAQKIKDNYLQEMVENKEAVNNLTKYITLKKTNLETFLKSNLNYEILDDKIVKYNKEGLLGKFYPMPSELENTTSPSEKDDFLIEKYGASNWYDWKVNKWGTKWDVDATIEIDSEEEVELCFDSAWSPPVNWLEKIYEDYPNLYFTLNYEESGVGFKGELDACFKDGLFNDNCYDWYGDCWNCGKDFNAEGECGCVGENGKALKWGEEDEE